MPGGDLSHRGPDAFARAARRWVGGVRRNAALVAVVATLLTIGAAVYTVRTITIDTDTASMISPELPFRKDAEALKRSFPQSSDTVVVVLDADTVDRAVDAQAALAARLRSDRKNFHTVFAPDADPFFARNGLLYLDDDELADLSDRLAGAQPLLVALTQDPSLRGLFDVLGLAVDEVVSGAPVPDGLVDVLERIRAVAASVASGTPRPLSWTDMMSGKTSTPADRRRFITTQPVLDYTGLQPAKDAMKAVRAHAAALGLTERNGVRLRLTGGAAMASEELKSVSEGAGLAGLISLVLVGVVLAIGLRSLRLVVAVLATLITGLVWTAGFTALAIGHLNLISVAFAVLFIGLAVDFGIHFGLRYKEEIWRGNDHEDALRNATGGVAGALGLCTLAAAASFYAFVPTDYDGLSELGLIAGTGMFIALAANLTILPALLTLMPLKPGRVATARAAQGAENLIRRRATSVIVVALVAGIAAASLLPSARFDFNPVSLKDPTTESVRTFLELMRDSETAPYTIQVLAPDTKAARALAEKLTALPEVDHTLTVADFIPSGQAEKLGIVEEMAVFMAPLLVKGAAPPKVKFDRAAALAGFRARLAKLKNLPAAHALESVFARLADKPEALAGFEVELLRFLPGRLERLLLALGAEKISRADLPTDLRAHYLAADGITRIQVFPAENINDNAALRRFVVAVRRIAPRATDSPVEIVESGAVVVGAIRDAAIIALVLILILLAVVLRNLRESLLVILPLVLAALLTVATSVLLAMPFNFANVIVLPLLTGLGVASGIHLVLRARDGAGALSQTSTPRAVILSSLTTIGSFGSLAISNHRGTASMGELLTIAIAFTLICTLIVLPALMCRLMPAHAERS